MDYIYSYVLGFLLVGLFLSLSFIPTPPSQFICVLYVCLCMFTETFTFKKCIVLLFYRMTINLAVEGLYEEHNVSVSILTKHGPTLSIIRKHCVKVQVYRKIQTAPQRLDIWYHLLNLIFCFLVSVITLDLLWSALL